MNASDPSVLVYCFSFIALMLSYYLLILSWCCVFGELLRREKFSQSDSACLTAVCSARACRSISCEIPDCARVVLRTLDVF